MNMARVLPLSLANVRHLLLALLAVALILRLGGACEAMAATPATPAVQMSHCADMPAKPDKPTRADVSACALCVALPDPGIAKVANAPLVAIAPVAALLDRLAGLSAAPAPPPPKIA
jgi:hypothetical protein